MNINLKEFLRIFNLVFEDLWQNSSKEEWHKLAEKFDAYMHSGNNVDFIREFADYRKDYITSDLECAAFIKTLQKFKKERICNA